MFIDKIESLKKIVKLVKSSLFICGFIHLLCIFKDTKSYHFECLYVCGILHS